MATKTGSVGSTNVTTSLSTPQSLNITLDSSEYLAGAVTFNFSQYNEPFTGWQALADNKSIVVYLCDSAGSNKITLFTIGSGNMSQSMFFIPSTANINDSSYKLQGKELYIVATGDTSYILLYGQPTVSVVTDLVLTPVVQEHIIYATDRLQAGISTTQYEVLSDSHFSTGTPIEASTFNSQVLGL